MAVSFTSGNDFIVPSENGQTYLGGAGDDTYILSGTTVGANATIVIQDTEGADQIQLVGGLAITASTVTSNAIELTLSNNARVQILGADNFGYDVGGNALAGIDGTQQTFDTFVASTLGTTVPEQGESPSTGGGVTIPEGGIGENEPTTVNIDTGTPESPVAFDASGGVYEYADDAAVATHLEISGFGSDDAIAFTNAGVDNYAFANDGSDVMISYNYLDEGTMNVITLTGIVENNSLVYDPASFTDAVGFDPFVL
jgi:hypothetical protein